MFSKLCMIIFLSAGVAADNARDLVETAVGLPGKVGDDSACVNPGTCTEPDPTLYPFVGGRTALVPRQQWVESGGFCGALSIQSIAMTYGAYISQDLVRKAAPYQSGSHGDDTLGYEISTQNILPCLSNLNLNYDSWDSDKQPVPQGQAYLSWLKKQLSAGAGIVQFVLCAGDEHYIPQDDAPPLYFDHIEPFFKIYSKHPLSDSTVYNDDILVHGSDYSPDGDENLGYFRTFDSLLDDTDMQGNCANAGTEWKQNEMYPCLYKNQTYGTAITGLVNSKNLISTSLQVNATSEPDVREGNDPVLFQATLLIGVESGISKGSYVVSRFDGIDDFKNQKRSAAYEVECEEDSTEPLEHVDKVLFLSSSSVYYTVEKSN
ncbi:hypothetical protein TL16_g04092 [Triparma laevis f. inornata]|uniref:Peptidase C1A papain C-terminal domain-containing protein n=2 Tax=Triparma laevis TaxID=1534972 RepID=A0A9W7AZZ0_9STRA|nr:hypothetical protein TL16_g04092 [Triparma laevis f. inornata]GMH79591.1 hypothetical protein TrLO_g6263 [Triparma laevis f. longispina]